MLFNSYVFLFLFLPLVLTIYFALNKIKKYNLSKAAVIVFSFVFYGYMNPSYVLILLTSVAVNYFSSCLLERYAEKRRRRKVIGFIAVVFNIGLLFYFKYFDFFIENINAAFRQDFALINIALPLGISFFTFQQISFIVDRIRRKAKHYGVIDYALFVCYFPQLIAGPIVRHDQMIPQFCDVCKKSFNSENFLKGIRIFSIGLAKKVLLADELAKVVNIGYSDVNLLDTPSAIVTMVFYTFQILLDFSGYCDMAIGIGKMMNIDLPVNFDRPYLSSSVKEFWTRWHMTLNSFFTEYVYFPLGGSRCGKVKTLRNIMIVFLLSGIWHGANWTFILWGVFNGLFICMESLVPYEKLHKRIRQCITFIFTNFAWVLFRSPSVNSALILYKKVFSFRWTGRITGLLRSLSGFKNKALEKILEKTLEPGVADTSVLIMFLLCALLLLAASVYCGMLNNTLQWVDDHRATSANMVIFALIVGLCVISLSQVTVFLYFNF